MSECSNRSMRTSWTKGYTKHTHPSVRKISDTMKRRKIDNFSAWRTRMRAEGKLKSHYPEFKKDGDLAELIGVVLGDGHIWKFPRTEELSIFSNSNNPGFVERYSKLVEKVFDKQPALTVHSGTNCIRIRIYQKNISARLGVPMSPRGKLRIVVPRWVLKDREFIVRYLRGLYEAEGSFCIHKATYTYKFLFSNRNTSMLSNVSTLLKKLGFHPHTSHDQVQLSRKKEVLQAKELIQFRKYT
jgi:intein/homing endonuclease